MEKVKVNVEFFNEVDDNLELYTLVAKIRYSIPNLLGFKKSKEIEWRPIQDATIEDWLYHMAKNLTKPKIKALVQGYVREDIMNRLQKTHEKGTTEIMNRVLNMLNQIKFDFNIDINEAQEIIANVNKVDFQDDEIKKIGKVQSDYFNFHSKAEPCTICR